MYSSSRSRAPGPIEDETVGVTGEETHESIKKSGAIAGPATGELLSKVPCSIETCAPNLLT
jgi:hypothetical protein